MSRIHLMTGSLPEEMVVEILLRIPVRSVWGLRVVSKSWNALITNDQFALQHLDHNNTKHILFTGDSTGNPYTSASLFRVNRHHHTLFAVDSSPRKKYDFQENLNFLNFFEWMDVAGSINGVICVCSHYVRRCRFIALWNPVINRWKPILLPLSNSKLDHSVGFAFDSLTNDYKIIVIEVVGMLPLPSSRVQIYSANQDSWLVLNSTIPYFTMKKYCSVIYKGVPYWSKSNFSSHSHYPETNVIATIDPHTGSYKGISYPQIVIHEYTTVHIVNMMDSLAVLIYSLGNNLNQLLHVYALDETSATWTKKYTTGLTPLQNKTLSIIWYFEDAGKSIVVVRDFNRSGALFYDLKTDCLCDSIGLDRFCRPTWSEACYHVESMVSINGMELIRGDQEVNNSCLEMYR